MTTSAKAPVGAQVAIFCISEKNSVTETLGQIQILQKYLSYSALFSTIEFRIFSLSLHFCTLVFEGSKSNNKDKVVLSKPAKT